MSNTLKIKLYGDLWSIPNQIRLGDNDIDASFNLFNLETPLLDDRKTLFKRNKAGPHIYGSAYNFKNICSPFQNPIFSLANNHIMDFGEEGLNDTIDFCQGMNYIGAGSDLNSAKAPLFIKKNDIKIGILARCETQFGIASSERAGVAFIDSTLYQSIQALKLECDFIIVSIHGSVEMCPWPSPKWQDYLRSLIDVGANVVHGHHSHIPQGYEKYKDGFIFYGLGNFLVEPKSWSHYSNTLWSITPVIQFNKQGCSCLIKTAVIKEENQKIFVTSSKPEEYDQHLCYLKKCNAPLYDRNYLEGLWQESSIRMYNLWYSKWLGFTAKDKKVIVKLKKLMRNRLSKLKGKILNLDSSNSKDINQLLLWYHLFACESHKEVISTGLGVISGEVDDLRTNEISLIVDEMMPWSVEK